MIPGLEADRGIWSMGANLVQIMRCLLVFVDFPQYVWGLL
jgi:hypothetical protein